MLTNRNISGLSDELLNAYWRVVEARRRYWLKRANAGNTKATAKADALSRELSALYSEMDRRMALLSASAVRFFIHTGMKFKVETI